MADYRVFIYSAPTLPPHDYGVYPTLSSAERVVSEALTGAKFLVQGSDGSTFTGATGPGAKLRAPGEDLAPEKTKRSFFGRKPKPSASKDSGYPLDGP